MKLPIYAVVGIRLVKLIDTPDGGMSVQVWDPATGEFKLDRSYLEKVMITNPDTDIVSEAKFEEMVEAAKARREARLADK